MLDSEYSKYRNDYIAGLRKDGFSETSANEWTQNSGGLELYIARQETKQTLPVATLGLVAAATTKLVYSAVFHDLSTRGGNPGWLVTEMPAIAMGFPTAIVAGICLAFATKPLYNALKNYSIFAMKDIASSDPPEDNNGNPLSTF